MKNNTSHKHIPFLKQQTTCVCSRKRKNAAPQWENESPSDRRAPVCFLPLSAEFEPAQKVCPTYTEQQSFIRTLLTRHHKSRPSSCFTRQHPNRVASSLALPSSPHINLSVCTPGHPLTVPVSVSPPFTEKPRWQASQTVLKNTNSSRFVRDRQRRQCRVDNRGWEWTLRWLIHRHPASSFRWHFTRGTCIKVYGPCCYCHWSIAAASSATVIAHRDPVTPYPLWCHSRPLHPYRFMLVHIWRRYWHLNQAEGLAGADSCYLR